MHRPVTGWLAAALTLASIAPSVAAAPGLCQSGETVVFSCQTRKGIASVCRAPAATDPQVHYRFGSAGHVDLAYPQGRATPREAFLAGTMTYSGGGGAYLQFVREAFRYTVFTAIGRWGEGGKAREIAGVAIAKGDKDAAALACTGAVTSELGPELFTALGLKAKDDGFDIPEAFFGK